MSGIINDLILMANRPTALFGNEVLDAAVPSGSDAPLELQLKVVEFINCDDVAAAQRVATVFSQKLQAAVFHHPSLLREFLLLKATPASGGFPVKEQFPTGGLLSFAQCIRCIGCFPSNR